MNCLGQQTRGWRSGKVASLVQKLLPSFQFFLSEEMFMVLWDRCILIFRIPCWNLIALPNLPWEVIFVCCKPCGVGLLSMSCLMAIIPLVALWSRSSDYVLPYGNNPTIGLFFFVSLFSFFSFLTIEKSFGCSRDLRIIYNLTYHHHHSSFSFLA